MILTFCDNRLENKQILLWHKIKPYRKVVYQTNIQEKKIIINISTSKTSKTSKNDSKTIFLWLKYNGKVDWTYSKFKDKFKQSQLLNYNQALI